MARRGRRKHGYRSKRYPLAIMIPALVPALDPLKSLMAGGTLKDLGLQLRYNYLGVDGTGVFRGAKLQEFVIPMLIGIGVHKIAGPKINRYLPKPLGI